MSSHGRTTAAAPGRQEMDRGSPIESFPDDVKSRLLSRYQTIQADLTRLSQDAQLAWPDDDDEPPTIEEMLNEGPPLTEEDRREYEEWCEWALAVSRDISRWKQELYDLELIEEYTGEIHTRKAQLRLRLRSFGDELTMLQFLADGWKSTLEIVHAMTDHRLGVARARRVLNRLVARGDVERQEYGDGPERRIGYRLRRSTERGPARRQHSRR